MQRSKSHMRTHLKLKCARSLEFASRLLQFSNITFEVFGTERTQILAYCNRFAVIERKEHSFNDHSYTRSCDYRMHLILIVS